jgi:predicted nucleic acid-binding Zn ribbon protein
MSDEPLVDCPECGKPQLKRLISAPRFRLKGAGWYETDFKKDNQRNVLKSDSEPAKSGSSDSSAGADKKADKAPDRKDPATAAPSTKAASKSASKTD